MEVFLKNKGSLLEVFGYLMVVAGLFIFAVSSNFEKMVNTGMYIGFGGILIVIIGKIVGKD